MDYHHTFILVLTKQDLMGRSPGLVVMGIISKRSWVRIQAPYIGWSFFTLIWYKNCIVCLKRLKINEKEPGVGPFKKRFDGRPNSGRKSFLLNKMGPSIVTLSKSTSSEFDLKHNFITVYFVTLAGTNTVKNFFSAHR